MATAKRTKATLEFLLVKAEVKGIPEKGLLRSRNIGQVDLIWPRTGVAKKSGAREMVFKRGTCDFTAEPWTKRVVFREEIEDPDGSPWPTFGYENSRKVQPTGMCCWDGATRVGLAYTSGRTIQMADFADPLHPNLVWHESTAGNPENGVFDNFGRLLVPCGYQGLLVEKRIFGDDGNPRGQLQLGNKTKGNHEK